LKLPKIALVGNPNSGKSSLFNQLTGLNQKVGNFPGITVEKHTGICQLAPDQKAEVLDLPGTYSLYPKSPDESIVIQSLIHPKERPDVVVVVVDASNLKRNLLLFTQVRDLGLPIVLVLNLLDIAAEKGFEIDVPKLGQLLHTDIMAINARTAYNLTALRELLSEKIKHIAIEKAHTPTLNAYFLAPELLRQFHADSAFPNDYWAIQIAHQADSLDFLTAEQIRHIQDLKRAHSFSTMALQTKETLARYEIIEDLLQYAVKTQPEKRYAPTFSEKLDRYLVHRVWGMVIFLGILMIVFQAIFAWAETPMNLIEQGIGWLQNLTKTNLPAGVFTDLLADGILAGLGGIVVFIPQIAILFAFIAILEESGYMARVVFMMDKLMRKVGLNGRSVVPLISGVACAVPAIMATRTIDNWKERLITIFVTPLMSCSARLPVYAILIAMVVPNQPILGVFNLQGLALLGMYLLGFVMAILSALVMHFILRTSEKSILLMELPVYQLPRWRNVGITVWEKVKVFVREAGKVIMAISIILWVLATYGPGDAMQRTEQRIRTENPSLDKLTLENKISAAKLENSYAGHFGKFIEPVIAPLGYDWKIGIALITSFAAREVFVGTLSTIYSLGSESDVPTLRARLEAEVNPKTGKRVYTPAVGFSLLIFYAFAMQCMSTIAVVYRETKGWKYPLLQFIYLTALAYLGSWLVFSVMS
jgi:ferrous iron transport protein B